MKNQITRKFFIDFSKEVQERILEKKNMRDKTHMEFVERWADYVKNNSDWKKIHTEFINSQFKMHDDFIKRLLKEKGGKEKIIKIYKIKNIKGYKELLK